ncbi:MAG: hypothetical protein ABS81_09535 [Pseudonocardia sp. SCN 72-86]|nr:MAG: hypothetical protein ABS81_09535 [Pseudonocardia sp. SCN 72-86]
MQIDGVHEAWIALRQVVAAIDVTVDSVLREACDLSADRYIALRWLQKRDADTTPVAPGGLESELNLTSSGMSRLLGRMESSGYIVRTPSSTDRRAIEVSLTPAATEVLRRAQPHASDAIQRMLEQPDMPTSLASALSMARDLPASALTDSPGETEDLSISGLLTWHTVDAVSAADAHVVRQAIEPQVFAEAARYATDAAASDLMTIVVDMVRNINDPEAFFDADMRFHVRLAELCQNRILRDVYVHMLDRLGRTLKSVDGDSEATGPYLAQRAKVHADLVDAIRRHDLEALEVATRGHRLIRIPNGAVLEDGTGTPDSGTPDSDSSASSQPTGPSAAG